MRSIIKVGLRALRVPIPMFVVSPMLSAQVRFNFAKISKKE